MNRHIINFITDLQEFVIYYDEVIEGFFEISDIIKHKKSYQLY